MVVILFIPRLFTWAGEQRQALVRRSAGFQPVYLESFRGWSQCFQPADAPMPVCKVDDNVLPIGNRRYSRLETCATTLSTALDRPRRNSFFLRGFRGALSTRIRTGCSCSCAKAPRKAIGIRWPFRGNGRCPEKSKSVSKTSEPLSLWFLPSVAVHEKNLFIVNTKHARDRSSTVPWYRRGTVPWDRMIREAGCGMRET